MNSCIVLILKTVHVLTLKQTLTWAVFLSVFITIEQPKLIRNIRV